MATLAPATFAFPFCSSCGTTMLMQDSGKLSCNLCKSVSDLNTLPPATLTKTSSSNPTVKPSWAKSNAEQERNKASSAPSRATVDEVCIKCNHPQVEFYCLQLRSVDEGQTVFYDCPNCKYTWSLNN